MCLRDTPLSPYIHSNVLIYAFLPFSLCTSQLVEISVVAFLKSCTQFSAWCVYIKKFNLKLLHSMWLIKKTFVKFTKSIDSGTENFYNYEMFAHTYKKIIASTHSFFFFQSEINFTCKDRSFRARSEGRKISKRKFQLTRLELEEKETLMNERKPETLNLWWMKMH